MLLIVAVECLRCVAFPSPVTSVTSVTKTQRCPLGFTPIGTGEDARVSAIIGPEPPCLKVVTVVTTVTLVPVIAGLL